MSKITSLADVVGRDQLIKKIWRVLEKNSIVMTAERRFGKTTILRKLNGEPKDGFQVVFFDLEGCETPEEFLGHFASRAIGLAGKQEKVLAGIRSFLMKIGGTQIGNLIKFPQLEPDDWKLVYRNLVEAISKSAGEKNVVFLFDELPYMLQLIEANERKNGGSGLEALSVLNELRASRFSHDNIRMIYSGSLGLHHILNSLRNTDVSAEPLNDLVMIEVPPLDPAFGKELAIRELAENGVIACESHDVAAEVSRLSGEVPFYIERISAKLADSVQPVSSKEVGRVVDRVLTEAKDEWQMRHFQSRISDYYPGSIEGADGRAIARADLANEIITSLVHAEEPLGIGAILNQMKSRYSLNSKQVLLEMLRLLELDHYLVSELQNESKTYRLAFPLLKRWWILNN
ncbi:MAG: hypothetical protein R2684_15230 [Pyrinomonadaceae bacterium]